MLEELLQRLVPEYSHPLDAAGQFDRDHGTVGQQPRVDGVRAPAGRVRTVRGPGGRGLHGFS
jgi:hypothetical protein